MLTNSKKFTLLPNTKTAYQLLRTSDWEILYTPQMNEHLSAKDLLILKIYLCFIGQNYSEENFRKNSFDFFNQSKEKIGKSFINYY